jgi:hypothetical protein
MSKPRAHTIWAVENLPTPTRVSAPRSLPHERRRQDLEARTPPPRRQDVVIRRVKATVDNSTGAPRDIPF